MKKILVALLLADLVSSVFVSPAGGLETRNPFQAHPLGFILFGVFSIGAVLVVFALIGLRRGRPAAATQAAIGAALFVPTALSDLAGLFHPLRAPPPVRAFEYLVVAISLAAVGLAVRLRRA